MVRMLQVSPLATRWGQKTAYTLAAVIAVQMGYLIGVAAGFVADRDVTISQKALDRVPLGFVEWFSRFIHP